MNNSPIVDVRPFRLAENFNTRGHAISSHNSQLLIGSLPHIITETMLYRLLRCSLGVMFNLMWYR